jgi:hypothetical protein
LKSGISIGENWRHTNTKTKYTIKLLVKCVFVYIVASILTNTNTTFQAF